MKTIGIIAEYNPFHKGHEAQLRLLRERFGPDCRIVVALGGCFTQRGEAALFTKYARAEAAVRRASAATPAATDRKPVQGIGPRQKA